MNAPFSRCALALAVALVAAGCNAADESANGVVKAAEPAAQRAEFSQNSGQPAKARLDDPDFGETPAAPAAADPSAVTRDWFAGRWSDSGNCADAGDFARSGIYLLADGTRGMWNVQDSRLTVQHASGRAVIGLRRVDDRTVEIVNADGSVGRSIRC